MSKTIFEILTLSEKVLKESGIARPRREAEELIADVLDKRRLDLYLAYDRPLEEGELEGIRKALRRRKEGEPTPYIG
ncbi:MAG: Release factor glutamine methyltransferase, partial [Chlamydiae bacterium]|nr:Release factor glutamine methyltransferase [Chlamydiota bacterium]